MRYYLCDRTGLGTDTNPFRPAGVDGVAYTCIDLGPLLFVGTPATLTTSASVRDCGTDPAASIPAAVITEIETTFKIDLTVTALKDVLADLLITHAGATTWPALKPQSDGYYRIFLGSEVWNMPVVAGGAYASDTFTGADGSSLSAEWTDYVNPAQILGHRATAATVDTHWRSRHSTVFDTADMFVQVNAHASGTSRAGVVGRTDGANTNEYQFYWQPNPFWRLAKVVTVSGTTSFTVLAESAGPSSLVGELVRLEMDGSTLRGLSDGVEVFAAVSDTTLTGPNQTGIYGLSTDGRVDNYEAADLTHVTLTSYRPTSTVAAGGWTTTEASLHGALSDQVDTTIITGSGA